jgi:hypothetical protein
MTFSYLLLSDLKRQTNKDLAQPQHMEGYAETVQTRLFKLFFNYFILLQLNTWAFGGQELGTEGVFLGKFLPLFCLSEHKAGGKYHSHLSLRLQSRRHQESPRQMVNRRQGGTVNGRKSTGPRVNLRR